MNTLLPLDCDGDGDGIGDDDDDGDGDDDGDDDENNNVNSFGLHLLGIFSMLSAAAVFLLSALIASLRYFLRCDVHPQRSQK